MPALQYGLAAYRRDLVGLPEIVLRNMFVEAAPQNGAPVIVTRPGLALERNEGAAGIRGMFQLDGVLGGAVVTASDAVRLDGVSIGALPGFDRVRFAGGEGEALACAAGQLWRLTTASVAPVAFPDGAAVADVGYLRGRFLAIRRDTGQFYWSELLDGNDWPALNFATAERQADQLRAMQVVGDFLWLFGSETTEVWAPSGNAELPYVAIDGRVFSRGCLARDTVVVLDNAPFWVGDDGIVYRGGDTPQAISNNGIAERVAATAASELRAWAFPWRGHSFYALRTAQGTMVYDATSGGWSEFDTLGLPDWDAQSGVLLDNAVLAGSARSGAVWRLSDDVSTDAGLQMERRFTALLPVASGVVNVSNMRLAAAVGRAPVGVTPMLEMRTSRDGGFSWSGWRQMALGEVGRYRTRVGLHRLGMADAPGMVFDFRVTADAPVRISGLVVNEPFAGRGR